ncbi:MAG TPA: LLM class flavin-dependent oxidoreductase [Gaiellaceae bacterium]|jgi:alkanesulfonate monooxygenase SsuD/methylene tetrahydromethanopterin reductase-like flavin-dependent oxidoreductase (luciferase family)|nr:LLM class flavin-dependent oxidoreductase [Gaiellaceae bacterium]
MKLGVQLPEVERVVRREELMAMARAAEESGFDSLWVGDHLLYRGDGRPERGPWDCWTTLAWLAESTSRVELGPLVACTAFHPPGILARQAAAVHELSGGRLVAALGAGWNKEEFSAFGLPFDHHVSRFEEAFTIIRRLLAGERVTFEGRFHATNDAVLLPPLERAPRLMVGANAPRMLSITLPHVDAWNTWFTPYGNTVEGFARHNAEISEAAERAGRDPAAIERSACVLVEIDGGSGERPRDVPAVPAADLPGHLRALQEAGADEAILVLDPITEDAIRSVARTI